MSTPIPTPDAVAWTESLGAALTARQSPLRVVEFDPAGMLETVVIWSRKARTLT